MTRTTHLPHIAFDHGVIVGHSPIDLIEQSLTGWPEDFTEVRIISVLAILTTQGYEVLDSRWETLPCGQLMWQLILARDYVYHSVS